LTGSAGAGRRSYHPVMKTSGITAALPAQDLGRAKAFYVEKVGLQALESGFLKARDGQVGLTVGDGVSQLFVYPARARSSGEFTQAVIHVTDVRCGRGDEGPRCGVRGVRHAGDADRERHCPDARWRRGSVVQGLRRQPGRHCSSLRRISRVSEPPRPVAAQRPGWTVRYRLTHTQKWRICVGRAIRAESTPSRGRFKAAASWRHTAACACAREAGAAVRSCSRASAGRP
jgi:hypothetical protein